MMASTKAPILTIIAFELSYMITASNKVRRGHSARRLVMSAAHAELP